MFTSLGRTDTHAIVLLKQDHHRIEKLFAQFEGAKDSAKKVRLARDICTGLAVHARLEEMLLYPAALRVLDRKDDALVHEAAVEHRSLEQLVAAIDGTGPGDRLFSANVTVLMEYVKHHVREEEHELFPKLEKSKKLDLEALGKRIVEERAKLMAQLERHRVPASRTRVSAPAFGSPSRADRSVTPRGSKAGARRASGSAARGARGTAVTRAAAKRKPAARTRRGR